jgi:hypothetical protein
MQRGIVLNAKVFRAEPMRYFSHVLDLILRAESFLNLIEWQILWGTESTYVSPAFCSIITYRLPVLRA